MDKILDKFGVYDLMAVLLTGICISTFSIIVLRLSFEISIDIDSQIQGTIMFLVISYFLGLIFQELGSHVIHLSMRRKNGLLKKALKTEDNSHIYLTDTEKDGVESYIIKELNLNPDDDNDNVIYNYCKYHILNNRDTTRMDKDQSISAMSRSLSLYFTVLAVSVAIRCFHYPAAINVAILIISLALAVLLYYRCVRFAKIRYVYVYRTFYYCVVV